MLRIRIWIPLGIALALSACAIGGGTHELPHVAAPASWSVGTDASVERSEFWPGFESAELERTIARALVGNADLEVALQRVEQARAQLRMTGSALWPSLSAGGGASRSYQESSDGSRWSGLATLSYELDLFGRHRSQTSAARERAEARSHDRDALRLVVTTDAAALYTRLLAFNDRIAIADGNLKDAEEVLRIVKARAHAGSASGLEVSQQHVVVNNLRASRASLVEQRTTTRNALAVLLGEAPQDFEPTTASLESLSMPEVSLAPPAALLADGRPDIRSIEAELRAMDGDIAAARAAVFPTLSFGTDASLAAGLGDPASMALSLASSTLAPIFSGGRLRAELASVTAEQRALAAEYRKTVLVAFQEVEDALAALASAREQSALASDSVEHARNAYRIAEARFRAGTIDYATLLETQRSLAQARDGGIVAELAELEGVLQLHKALGGA
jgi:outer membrane protein, multidrug efflux system